MIGFIIGLFVGSFIGVLVMCLMSVAKQSDNDVSIIHNKTDKE